MPTRDIKETDYEDEVAADQRQADTHSVSTAYAPDTARRLRKGSIIVACVLIVALLLVRVVGFFHERALASEARTAAAAPHTVDVITAAPVGAAQHFALPGQTAAWHSSTIYARVNGYVASWVVDIGDHVHAGQIMATIETPELDAELSAARAQLKSAQAQVEVRKAEAAFAKTTFDRWRDLNSARSARAGPASNLPILPKQAGRS